MSLNESLDREFYFIAESLNTPVFIQALPFLTSTSKPPVFCPRCNQPCARLQELKRHLLSNHLPDWIRCPHPHCRWRGHRREDLKSHREAHLNRQNCGPKLSREQYTIYDIDLVLGWILDDKQSVEKAARYALDFVSEKAQELGIEEEWANLWGPLTKENSARRRNHQRRGGCMRARPQRQPKTPWDVKGVDIHQSLHYSSSSFSMF
ncbi:hypothetical protein BJV78DRAFT_590033 [Lactifluus subvellereus]|nr:hypothetical protein BJV78DRAFT_590033 [Lactifluus subvellereus]